MRAIGGTPARDLDARRDVRLGSDEDMRLDPLGLHLLFAVLVVKPPFVNAGREAGRIGGKIGFDGTERAGAFLDQRLENRRDLWVFQHVKDAVKVRSLVDISALDVLLHIDHRAATAGPAVNLHNGAKEFVRERKARTPVLVDRVVDSGAESVEQVRDPFLLDGLRGVVRGPILPVRYAHRLLDRRLAVGLHRMANRVFDRVEMLALEAALLKVGTSAVRPLRSRLDHIGSAAGLRRHNPQRTLLLDAFGLGESDTALFPGFHTSILLQGIEQVNALGGPLTYILNGYMLRVCQRLGYGATAASGAITNGSRGTKIRSPWSVQSAKVPIGIRLAGRSPLGYAA